MPDLIERLPACLTARWGMPVRVENARRFHGGAARETWRFDAVTARATRGLVARRDPQASLIDTSRAVEFHALRRAHSAGLPVPEPLFLDETGDELGSPGFVMAEVATGKPAGLFEEDPYAPHAAAIGAACFDALGRLHALAPDAADRAALPMMDAAARVRHWRRTIQANADRPQPVAMAALRWLERHCPPTPERPAIVHGDFRSGNLLTSEAGELTAILDWEMAHVGDPMEDLAWACDPLWAHGGEDAAAMLPRDAAIAAWRAGSGRAFDAAHWNWWRLYAGVMGLAIWISSAHEVVKFRTVDPVMVFAGLYPYRFHNAQVSALLAELAG